MDDIWEDLTSGGGGNGNPGGGDGGGGNSGGGSGDPAEKVDVDLPIGLQPYSCLTGVCYLPLGDGFHPFGLNSDYYSLSIYHGFVGWLLAAGIVAAGWAEPTPAEEIGAVALALMLNGGVTLSIDRYGNLYISPGLSLGLNSFEPLPTVSVVEGNLVHGREDGFPIFKESSPNEIQSLLTEFSTTHSVCHAFFPCVGTTRSPAAPYNSIEFGAGFPAHVNFITASFGFGPYPVVGNP